VKSNRLLTFLMIGAGFVVIGLIVGATANVFPAQASAEAATIDTLFNVMLAIAVVVFLIVEGGIVYTIWRFRKRPGDETDGANIHGNMALEITWTAIPTVIVIFLSIYSWSVFNQTRTPSPNEIAIGAIGQQFQWKFAYALPANADPALTEEERAKIASYMISADLVMPVNQPVRLDIEALDVLHAIYIPEFRVKQDAIPGRVSNAYFTPIQVMESWVLCAELCGVGHAAMSQINKVYVRSQADYETFINDLYANAVKIASDPRSAEVGKQLIVNKYPCGTCHVVTELGLKGNIGPSLEGVADRAKGHAEKGEGLVGGTDAAAYLRGSIVNPNGYLVSGYNAGLMPQNYGLPSVMPEDDREAIINYLLTLTQDATASR
jgi:cytochrome c oxidase subunit II